MTKTTEPAPAGHAINPLALAECRRRGWPDARTMSDQEFADAVQRKAWRDQPAAASLPPAAPPPSGNTAATAPTPEPAQPKGRRAEVAAMSDQQFNEAVKRRAWR